MCSYFVKFKTFIFHLCRVFSLSDILVYFHCFCHLHRDWLKLKCVMCTHPNCVLHRDEITFPLEKYDMHIYGLEEAAVCLLHYQLCGHCTQAERISCDQAYSLLVCSTDLLLSFTFILCNVGHTAKEIS
jgi:hypothetical protein